MAEEVPWDKLSAGGSNNNGAYGMKGEVPSQVRRSAAGVVCCRCSMLTWWVFPGCVNACYVLWTHQVHIEEDIQAEDDLLEPSRQSPAVSSALTKVGLRTLRSTKAAAPPPALPSRRVPVGRLPKRNLNRRHHEAVDDPVLGTITAVKAQRAEMRRAVRNGASSMDMEAFSPTSRSPIPSATSPVVPPPVPLPAAAGVVVSPVTSVRSRSPHLPGRESRTRRQGPTTVQRAAKRSSRRRKKEHRRRQASGSTPGTNRGPPAGFHAQRRKNRGQGTHAGDLQLPELGGQQRHVPGGPPGMQRAQSTRRLVAGKGTGAAFGYYQRKKATGGRHTGLYQSVSAPALPKIRRGHM